MRRLLCILLTVAMIILCIPAAFASENPEEAQPATFHAPTIRKMIEANLAVGNADESFFHSLANAYLTDPAKMAVLLQEFPEDILYLAKAISYDLQKTGRASQASIPDECDTPESNAVAKLIYGQASLTANATLDAFYSAELQTSQMLANSPDAASGITVSKLTLSVEQEEIYTTATASFTISRQAAISMASEVSYTVYRKNDTGSVEIGRGIATIPGYTNSVRVRYNFTNNTLGDYQIYVKVSSSDITSNLSDKVSVTGTWHITVELTEDRTELGTITLFNGEGTQVSSSYCLGLSMYNTPMNQIDGNTPIGVYSAVIGEIDANTYSYGPYNFIRIYGISGYVVEECSHRDRLVIHGGDPSTVTSSPFYPLRATKGCVRVTNDYQASLVSDITSLINSYHGETGRVTITQNGQTTL